jgi:hypothetical protein
MKIVNYRLRKSTLDLDRAKGQTRPLGRAKQDRRSPQADLGVTFGVRESWRQSGLTSTALRAPVQLWLVCVARQQGGIAHSAPSKGVHGERDGEVERKAQRCCSGSKNPRSRREKPRSSVAKPRRGENPEGTLTVRECRVYPLTPEWNLSR